MPLTTSNDLNTSAKWDGSNEPHDSYKAWVNDVSLRVTNNQMVWIMKIAKRLQEAPNFRRAVFRAPPLREQFLAEAHLLAKNSSPRSKDLQKLTQVKILPKRNRPTT